MKKLSINLLITFFLSSCGIYSNRFQCPPGKGLGCASVGEVLDLIVEREGEEDLLIKDKKESELLKQQEKEKRKKKKNSKPLTLTKTDSGKLVVIQEEPDHDLPK